MSKPTLVLDVECYTNYFLISVMNVANGKVMSFEKYEDRDIDCRILHTLLSQCKIVTFNGIHYDFPMLAGVFAGYDCLDLKRLSDLIIQEEMKAWQLYKNSATLIEPEYEHIDLIEVAPGVRTGLKIYGGRLHSPKMQDLPIDPSQMISPEETNLLRLYCKNDLEVTANLYKALTEQLVVREVMSDRYGINLMSKSDAQIAEAVIVAEISKVVGMKLSKPKVTSYNFTYEAPEFVSFLSEDMKQALEIATTRPFHVKANGVVEMPKELEELKIAIGSTLYQMGMGGLHSTEKSVHYEVCDEYRLFDYDVTSYYPSIILNCGLYPNHLGPVFLDVYRKIVEERVAAKADGDKVKADTLKICINGSFGKLGSPYSMLYAPNLMIQTTVTGQLALLMLIERLERNGVPVVSGNTDGVVIKCPSGSEAKMQAIVAWWEKTTGFFMESAEYRGLYSRDVNNYIAIKMDGKVKTKGCFASASLMKNPQNEICIDAVIGYLKYQIPVDLTVVSCTDVTKFLSVRKVTGGAVKVVGTEMADDWIEISDRVWVRETCPTKKVKRKSRPPAIEVPVGGEHIGKVVRWYYSTEETGYFGYSGTLNKVPRSDGARALLDLPDTCPSDIDYDWYIREVQDLLKDVGLST